MKARIGLLAALLICAVPVAQADAGTVCNDRQTILSTGSGPDIFAVRTCGPSAASIDDEVTVSTQVQTNIAGHDIVLPDPSTWTYLGCSYVSTIGSSNATLNVARTVKVAVEASSCSVSFLASLEPTGGGATKAVAPGLVNIYDGNVDAQDAAWALWLPVFFFAALILYGESRHNSLATFAGVFGLISEFVVGGVASRSFFIFLGMISVAFSSWMKAWFGKSRGKK